ncbi:hypothetical protein PR202_gb05602 [Eleusine coracana subsp. coracana]|uniref:F-box/LRR-repeat protein 15/At3g58940/PEG3-like LRR domain-containing protein n=1 Tax=Eleusine coracana subsp. coracana TaxID=191504 RepID=A0AAV5E7F8_ELECO|nr:hypothetical protein PR202_gb05602 [Eleusine coracana subsp. coracana]
MMEGSLPIPKPLIMEEEVIATGAAKKTLPPMLAVTMKALGVQPTPTNERSTHGQELLLTDAMKKEEGEGIDHISGLPDDILGTIVSILPTAKDVARTQVIAPQWRHIWLTVPLRLNLADLPEDNEILNNAVSGILSAHPGPGSSFCVQSYHLYEQNTTLSAWLRSPALNNLKELNLWDELSMFSHFHVRWKSPPPMSAVRFSTTLQVASLCKCKLTGTPIDKVHFPQLRQLALDQVIISKDLLHTMISNCSVLEFLLLNRNSGYGRVLINSSSLRSIGVGWNISNEPFIEQHKVLEMEKRASRDAQLDFVAEICFHDNLHIDHVRDLSLTDPFECRS